VIWGLLVPRGYQAVGGHDLAYSKAVISRILAIESLPDVRHPFLLATTNAPQRLIANDGVLDVLQPKDGFVEIGDASCELIATLPRYARLRGPRLRCEVDCLVDGERGEVDIVFRAILNVTPIALRNLGRCQGVVYDITFNRVKAFSLVGQHL
jgi:hypothetical protein